MHLIDSRGLVLLQVPYTVSNLIYYSWRVFILLVPAFAFCELGFGYMTFVKDKLKLPHMLKPSQS